MKLLDPCTYMTIFSHSFIQDLGSQNPIMTILVLCALFPEVLTLDNSINTRLTTRDATVYPSMSVVQMGEVPLTSYSCHLYNSQLIIIF